MRDSGPGAGKYRRSSVSRRQRLLNREPVPPDVVARAKPSRRATFGFEFAQLGRGAEALEHLAELRACGDADFREDPVQVRANRAVREVEVLSDLAIGHPAGCHRRDLQLLRGRAVASVGSSATAGLAARAEFLSRPIRPWARADCVEVIARFAELTAGFGNSPVPSANKVLVRGSPSIDQATSTR